jgi:hypothetical protein
LDTLKQPEYSAKVQLCPFREYESMKARTAIIFTKSAAAYHCFPPWR